VVFFYWQAIEAIEILFGVNNGNRRYMYAYYIYYIVCQTSFCSVGAEWRKMPIICWV